MTRAGRTLAVAAVAAAGAYAAGTQAPALAQTADPERLRTVTLQLKWRHQFQSAGYYAAIEQGYYRAAGLEVVLREPEVGEEPADVVLRGGAEFGVATSDLVVLHSRGEPVVVLAPIFQHSPYVFLVADDAGVSSVHDLKGRTLMIEAHADELLAYLEFEGIGRDEVTLVPHTFDPSLLIEGTVTAMSAYSTDEPFLLQERGVGYLTFTPRAAGIDFYGDTLFTTAALIEREAELVQRFLEASLRGWDWALAHPEATVDLILARYSQRHSREHLRFEAERTRRLILPDVLEIGYLNPGRWRHIADVYARLGMMPAGAPLEGLLYRDPRGPDLRRFYAALGLAALVILGLSLLVLWFIRLNAKIRQQAASLSRALAEIKVLEGIIPICAHCKKVRDDQGYWNQVESYIAARTDAEFSHGICAACLQEHFPEFQDAGVE